MSLNFFSPGVLLYDTSCIIIGFEWSGQVSFAFEPDKAIRISWSVSLNFFSPGVLLYDTSCIIIGFEWSGQVSFAFEPDKAIRISG